MGNIINDTPKSTSFQFHGNTSYDVAYIKICPSVFALFYATPKSYALQCFPIGQDPQKCPFPPGYLHPRLIHGYLDSSDSASQSASRTIQPFLHSSSQILVYIILYNGRPRPPSELLIRMGRSGLPSNMHRSLVPPESASRTTSPSVQPLLQGSRL